MASPPSQLNPPLHGDEEVPEGIPFHPVKEPGEVEHDIDAKGRPIIRVCVLNSSYEGSSSDTKEYDNVRVTPAIFMRKDDPYTFEDVELKKATVYRDLRSIIKSNKYDVYFNLCDGAKDEDRAGEEVVRTLEEFNVPFTGSASRYFEINKPDMKMIALYNNICTARHAVLDTSEDVEEKCSHLRFPVIVKHVSGYASIGMTMANKCADMAQLKERVAAFVAEFDFALVEEFITGDEATVLACADDSVPGGIRVFHPVVVNFPEGQDFKHFDLKWATAELMEWKRMDDDDPCLEQVMDIGRRAFKEMMGGIGYGRCDIRIDRERNEAVFLEINPNCGIMYPDGLEGSADWILKFNKKDNIHQREFAILQIQNAIRRQQKLRPKYVRSFDSVRGFHLRASHDIKKGTVVFEDEGKAVRLFTMPYVEKNWPEEDLLAFRENSWPIGQEKHYYAVWDVNPANWRAFNHSDDANLVFGDGRSLNMVAAVDIKAGEELTLNYNTCTGNVRPPKRQPFST